MFLKRKIFLFLSMFILLASFANAQGAILDAQYDNLPRRVEYSSLSHEGLPGSYSIKQYAPLPGDQGDYGTCVSWAASYAARTICESIALNRLNQTETTQNAFSVVQVYRNIRPDDPEGISGAQIYAALDFMRDTGAARMLDIEREVSFQQVDLAYYRTKKQYPIAGYLTLFSRDEMKKLTLITRIVKKSLTEGKPVIIAMNTPDSFDNAKNVWRPDEDPDYFYYAHALCVVGYDDYKYGGAFEVLNSWGRKWGNGGYIWIPYQVFLDFVYEGYEIIDNIAGYSDSNKFDSYVKMDVTVPYAENVSFTLTDNYYTAREVFTEDTQISFTIGARESAYVYSFSVFQPLGEDGFFTHALLFPHAGTSPLLNNSEVILPGGISLNTPGTEYLITLFSKQALDIQGIIRVFSSSAHKTINKRLAVSVGDSYTTALLFSGNEAAFQAAPDDPRAVAALIVALERK
ncbi:MAG: C1 family peptidase [Treponema sp.]|jgi:hypothetical protein|nr:C1 family peptidase [Treponema sp.]